MENNDNSFRKSITSLFSKLNFGKKTIKPKENKTNTYLEYIINNFTEYKLEDYSTHSKIFIEYDEIEAVIIIMKDCIFLCHLFPEDFDNNNYNDIDINFNLKEKENPIFSKLIFSQIYNFEFIVNQGELNSIILLYFEKDVNIKIQSKINFFFNKDSFIVHHLIKKNYILFWQIKFESNILKENESVSASSEIYQYHFYVKKINRIGKYQDRIIMCSTMVIIKIFFSSIYNKNLVVYIQH